MQAEGQNACAEVLNGVAPALAQASRPIENVTLSQQTLNAAAFDLPAEGIDLDALERRMVEQALARTKGNKTRAGALLGLTRDQVRYRMQKYGL